MSTSSRKSTGSLTSAKDKDGRISGKTRCSTSRSESGPGTHNRLTAVHVITAIRTLAALYADAADMLDIQSGVEILASSRQKPGPVPEVFYASLDPSTFVDPEDELGNPA